VPDPGSADGEGGREDDALIPFTDELRQPLRDVDVGGREHADVVELPQQLGRAPGAAHVERIDVEQRHVALRPSRMSLSPSTSGFGGSQANTPHGAPSTAGVSVPSMPRTNR
jgi:hypothetical protein